MPVTNTTQVTRFGHLLIDFDERVLRPRPWTERQSAWAARLLEQLPDGPVLELCAGAGHIGLLAVSGTGRHLVQVDADEVACAFARSNGDRAVGQAQATPSGWSAEVRHGWMEAALEPDERFALVIADPPWVPSHETSAHPEDPLTAIDGGVDGLDEVRTCLSVIGRHLAPRGAALLQVGDVGQAEEVRAYVAEHPDLGLTVVDHESLDEGTLVHLARDGVARATAG